MPTPRNAVRLVILFELLVLGGMVATPAMGARQISLPAYTRRVIGPWPGATVAGTQIAIILTATVNLTNMSNVPQSGGIELMNGSTIVGTQVGRGFFNRHIWVCANGGADSSSGSLPLNTAWSLPPNGTGAFQVGTVFHSIYNATGPSGHSSADASFTPIVRITVNEDRGALMGTLIPQVDGPVPGAILCSGFDLTPFSSPMLTDERSGVPLLVNGGRPF